MPLSDPLLFSVKAALNNLKTIPYCTATIPLDEIASTVYYRSGDLDLKAEYINLPHATESQLENLAKACKPDTFRMVGQDATHHARKMGASQFSTPFHPAAYGMAEVLTNVLLKGHPTYRMSVQMELVKLNVYQPGGFVKRHVNATGSHAVFGSLVVILPTVHEGGELILRLGNKTCTVDTANAVRPMEADPSSPHTTFVAFFRDVEQELTMLSSGYLVTLTYDLYLKSTSLVLKPIQTPTESQLEEGLSRLLENPSIFLDGGIFVFSLDHDYSIRLGSTSVNDIDKRLTGMDQSIMHICESLSIDISLRVVYGMPQADDDSYYPEEFDARTADYAVFLYDFADFGERWSFKSDAELAVHLSRYEDAVVAYNPGHKKDVPSKLWDDAIPMVWVKLEGLERTTFVDAYIKDTGPYESDASLQQLYGEVCLVAYVPRVAERLEG